MLSINWISDMLADSRTYIKKYIDWMTYWDVLMTEWYYDSVVDDLV
jgi:hypothetical protein